MFTHVNKHGMNKKFITDKTWRWNNKYVLFYKEHVMGGVWMVFFTIDYV